MGISGLLPLLRESQRNGHVEEFSGKTVGVDSYIWLYKGAFSCAADLALGQPTEKYITFFMQRARMLRYYGVEPFFVFDGGPLPSKRATELERRRNREEKRRQGIKLWNQSKRKAAFEQFQRSIEVTPLMAKAVIDKLKAEKFQYVVAPYEADAQLAYLESQGIISAAISEDSDLIVFGCQNVIFKLDQYGKAVIFDRAKLFDAAAVDIKNWTNEQIRRMCILSGCDYAASVPGVGLKKAHRYTSRSASIEMAVRLMRADGISVPDGYEDEANRANLTFLYQRVYDPRSKEVVHVTPLRSDSPLLEQMPFIGELLEPQVSRGIAEGDIDPFTHERLAHSASTPALLSPSQPAQTKSAPPAVRARNLHHFFVRPKDKTPTRAPSNAAKSDNSLAKPKLGNANAAPVSATPTKPDAYPVVEIGAPRDDIMQQVQVRFRAKTIDAEVVATKAHSRFFAAPNQAARTPVAPKEPQAEEDQQPPPAWPVTPSHPQAEASQASSEQDLSNSQTQVAALDDGAESPGELATQIASQCSTIAPASADDTMATPRRVVTRAFSSKLETPTNANIPRAQPESGSKSLESSSKRAFSLFDQFKHESAETVPEWVSNPVYKKGNR
ncbi:hypothetical protein GGI12_002782 [Dipsacomyces acuminosporus]|nr:hypothetical protein GGI12_002782 [Dipsacomyces acuminosporus]